MRRALLVLLAAVATWASGAGATDRGALQVVARRGPITPVCAIGVPCDGPAAGVRVVVRRNGLAVARGLTDRQGRVLLVLLPGRYLVTAAYGGGLKPQARSAVARVFAGRTARVRFSFDTGIR